MQTLPRIEVTREQMLKRVARFSDLKGSDGGFPDSYHPDYMRTLYSVIGFQDPNSEDNATTSPVGDDTAASSVIKISEGFNLGYAETYPGKGASMHNHDTNETFIPMTGHWRFHWEVGGKVEHIDLGPHEVISIPAGVVRRFQNVTFDEPDRKHLLMVVIDGNAPKAEFTDEVMEDLRQRGLVAA
jgi:mannose-6-phosphate isomerase-like protein (cupin superfamily)